MKHARSLASLGVICTALAACSEASVGAKGDGGVALAFESADPSGDYGNHVMGSGGAPGGAGGASTGGSDGSGAPPPLVSVGAGDTAQIPEAGLSQVEGTRLYAASPGAGLSILDVSNPTSPRLLGRLPLRSDPVRMFLRGGRVVVLTGTFLRSVGGVVGALEEGSDVLSVDPTDPAHPVVASELNVPGIIDDARWVGDHLYVAGHTDAFCAEGCTPTASITTLVSIDVKDLSALHEVSRVTASAPIVDLSRARVASFTDQRVYVATAGTEGSTIEVFDISDPGGGIVAAAKVAVDPWVGAAVQMSESNGALRVAGGSGAAVPIGPIVLQTLAVSPAGTLSPLSRVELPVNQDTFRGVQFDGARGYVISSTPTDPVLTLDLSDASAPAVAGSFAVSGVLDGFLPQGDRVFAVTLDPAHPDAAVTLSAFDTSDIAAPRRLDAASFGNDWSSLRTAGPPQVFPSEGLVTVAVAGYTSSVSRFGLKLIDFTGDRLIPHGFVETQGENTWSALRANELLAVGTDRLQAFDITDRSAPVAAGEAVRARMVLHATARGDRVFRLSQASHYEGAELDVTSLAGAALPAELGAVDLAAAVGPERFFFALPGARVFAGDGTAFAVVPEVDESGRDLMLLAVGVSDATSPALASSGRIGERDMGQFGEGGLVRRGTGIVQVGSTLVAQRSNGYLAPDGWNAGGAWLDVTDVSEPASPVTTRVDLPGDRGLGGLFTDGSTVLTSHSERILDRPGRVRFFLDRFDVSNAHAPRVTGHVNIPGSLVAWDARSHRAITVDYESLRPTRLSLKLVQVGEERATLEGTLPIDASKSVGEISMGSDRCFVITTTRTSTYYDPATQVEILVLSGIEGGHLDLAKAAFGATAHPIPMVASGQRALLAYGGLLMLDATDAAAPRLAVVDDSVEARELTLVGDRAVAAVETEGARVISLGQ